MNKTYTSIFTADDFDRILSSAVRTKKISEAGYERMKEAGTLESDLWYLIYDDAQFANLARVCVGPLPLIEIADRKKGVMMEERMSMEQYLQLRKERKVEPATWYSIYSDYAFKNLVAVYNGNTLILKKDENASNGFPYTFPITF